jgi:2-oxoglutaroyl-CoA hydrolase
MTKLVHPAQRLLAELDGFRVEFNEADSRADIILDRPPFNVVSMFEREQLRVVFEALDEDPQVRVIVVRAIGEHFSSGGDIKGFIEASPEHVSKLAWNIASPTRCSKPVIAANRGYCFGVGFELSLAISELLRRLPFTRSQNKNSVKFQGQADRHGSKKWWEWDARRTS